MISIVPAEVDHIKLLTDLGGRTYMESHGHCAKASDVEFYLHNTYNDEAFLKELSDPKNIYHLIYFNHEAAGYSKIILDSPHSDIPFPNVTKLERIYILKEFHGMNAGPELFSFNLLLSKNNNQSGMWLYVWKENQRAFRFYQKQGFRIIGEYDFRISPTHTNPNYHMFLEY